MSKTVTNSGPMAWDFKRSITDQARYEALLDFTRAPIVRSIDEDLHFPPGRILYHDTFEDATLKWLQNTGTVARDTTTAHRGTACLKLTTGAVAGNQAIARKFFQIPADQGFQQSFPIANRQARIAVIFWFRQADVNLREFHARLLIDDTARQREFWWQFQRRNLGVNQNFMGFLNSAGGFTNVTTYPLDDGTANTLDAWNVAWQEVDYNNGTDAGGGYGSYRRLRIGDFISTRTAGADASNQGATAAVRNALVDLVITTDVAIASAVFIDDFWLLDLSASVNQ